MSLLFDGYVPRTHTPGVFSLPARVMPGNETYTITLKFGDKTMSHAVSDATLIPKAPYEPPYARPIQDVVDFFDYKHLPPHLQEASKPFNELAHKIASASSNAETTVALRRLLEAKDAAVRAVLVESKRMQS